MISVVIPVYNSKNFIEQAVNSAAHFDIVDEIILIEDGSEDESYTMCEQLVNKHSNVKLFTHEGRKNKGAAASRNLGTLKASNDWIAFLDADDYFLPNRFDDFSECLRKEIYFDGIYEAAIYEDSKKIYSISKSIDPKKLFHFLIRGTYGHFCTNGIIVKKDLLIRAGLFDESLRLHQDSELWLRLSFYGKLISGNLNEPIAVIRRHENNRIWKGTSSSSRYKQWIKTWNWAKNERVGFLNMLLILRKIFKYKFDSILLK